MTIRKIILLAFLLRFGWALVVLFLNPDGIWVYDSYGYWYLGKNMLENHAFSQCVDPPFDPDYFRTPLYPIYLAVFQLFKADGFIIIVSQVIFSSLTCYFTYRLAKEILPEEQIALIASLIVAIDVPSVLFTSFIMTETIFSFLFIVFFLLFVKYIKEKRFYYLIFSAFFLGLCILCRPIAAFLPVLLFVFLFYIHRKEIISGITRVVSFSVIILLVIFPWLIRNKQVFGEYSLSYLGSHSIMNMHAANILAEKKNVSWWNEQASFRQEMIDSFPGNALKEPAGFAAFIKEKGMDVIKKNPVIFLVQHVKNVFEFFFKPARGYTDFQLGNKNRSLVAVTFVIFQVLLMVLVYLGFLRGLFFMKGEYLFLAFLLIVIFYFANMTVPPMSEARLRIPVMPLIALVSAGGIISIRTKP